MLFKNKFKTLWLFISDCVINIITNAFISNFAVQTHTHTHIYYTFKWYIL